MADLPSIVDDRVEKLRRLDASAIRSLPELSRDRLPPDILVSQHHVVGSSGEHLLVVQAGQDHWFGLKTSIVVGGFVLLPDGTCRELTDEEKSPYA